MIIFLKENFLQKVIFAENTNKIDNLNLIDINYKSLKWITIEDLNKHFIKINICHITFNDKIIMK